MVDVDANEDILKMYVSCKISHDQMIQILGQFSLETSEVNTLSVKLCDSVKLHRKLKHSK